MTARKKVIVGIAATAVASVAAGLVIFTFFPEVILAVVRRQYERASGVTAKAAVVNGYTIPYYEGGKGEPLVLVHGFGDSKISFVQCAQWLTPHYRVILPEVPGFGETERDPALDYGTRAQAERLHAFVRQLGITKFHLGGNSMGGHITASYALHYPDDLLSIMLIDASGIRVPQDDPYVDVGGAISTVEEFDAYMDKLFVHKPEIPASFKRYFIKQSQKKGDWLKRVREDIRKGPDAVLNDRAAQIRVPTLVLWGDKDQLVPMAVGDFYHNAIAGSKLVVFENCGHVPQLERPKETAEALLAFLKSVPKQGQ